jgi:hypothetical protein
MSNFSSNYVEMNPLKTGGAIASADSIAAPTMRGSTVPRFACLVVVNLDLQDYTPPG